MTSISDPRPGAPSSSRVHYNEPAIKPPPLLAVGPVAWIRNNLFRSTFDTILTLAFGAIAISVIVGVVGWAITSANWFVITKNLRLFMVGRFPVDSLWRVEWLALYLLFLTGFAIAVWSRPSPVLIVTIVVILVLAFGLPPLINAVTPPETTYFTAGNEPIASGTITETPQQIVGFIGRGGETVSIRVASRADSDVVLADLDGFFDRATAAVVNAAKNRLATEARINAIEQQLADDGLTESQRAALSADFESMEVPPPVFETLGVNSMPVEVEILHGETLDVIASATLTADSDALSMTLPDDGWYVLRKTVEQETGVALLAAEGIEPLMVSELSALDVRYRSMTEDFETAETRPKIDGRDVPMINITDYQYAGLRSFGEYLRLHLAPFLDQINLPLLYLTLAGVVGYVSAKGLDRARPRTARQGKFSQRVISLLLLTSPIVTAILLSSVDAQRWGGLLLTFMLTAVGLIASFPIGVLLALGRRSKLPVVKWTCILFIELVRGVPLITVLFIANLMLPLLNPALVSVEGVIRAMVGITLFSAAYLAENVRGGLQSIPPGQEEAAKAVGLNNVQITVLILLPQALRAVIPALVGQAISLFKDTSLVAIIGLFDLTRISDSVIAQPEFINLRMETYLFISIIYFLFSYLMGYVSRRLEESGSGQARRV